MNKFLLAFGILFILLSCSLNELNPSNQKNDSFSIEEAKTFFEEDYFNGLTKTNTYNRYGILNPGDFTPKWDTAIYSTNGDYAAYDVDIYSRRHTICISAEFVRNKSKAYKLPVYQKLVIIKNLKSEKLYSYILSLIPNTKIHNNEVLRDYRSLKQKKKNYSGLAIYTSTTNGSLNRIHKYSHGKKIDAVLMNDTTATFTKRCNKIISFFSGMELLSHSTINTKSGEDWWEEDDHYNDDYNETDQYENFIDWFMTEIWPNAEDGDSFTMNYDETGDIWYLENQNGDTFIVPDEVCTGDDSYDDWDNDEDGNFNDDNSSNNDEGLDNIILQVYCSNCKKHLGTANFDNLDDKMFYCDECKMYFKIP